MTDAFETEDGPIRLPAGESGDLRWQFNVLRQAIIATKYGDEMRVTGAEGFSLGQSFIRVRANDLLLPFEISEPMRGSSFFKLTGASMTFTLLGPTRLSPYDTKGNDSILESESNNALRMSDGAYTVRGGEGRDDISAKSGPKLFYGEGGNNELLGGEDNDSLLGGDGRDDELTGGPGADVFRLAAALGNDVFTDFGPGDVVPFVWGGRAADEPCRPPARGRGDGGRCRLHASRQFWRQRPLCRRNAGRLHAGDSRFRVT